MLTGNVRVMSAEALGLTSTTGTDTVTVSSDYTAWKQGVETTLGAHRDSITVMGGVVADLQSTVTLVSSFSYNDSYLKGQVTIANNNISSLQSSVTSLGGRLDAIESLNLGNYSSILTGLSGAGTWNTDINSLKSAVTVLSGSVAGALEIANGVSTMAQAVSRTQSSLNSSISNLGTSIGGANTSISSAISSIQSNATVVSGIQSSLGNVISFVDSLDDKVLSLESGLNNITINNSIPDSIITGSIKGAASLATTAKDIADGLASTVKSMATVVSSQGVSLSSAVSSINSTNNTVTLMSSCLGAATVSLGGAISSIGNLNNSVTGLNSSVTTMSNYVANFVNIPIPFVNVTGTNYTIGNLGTAINEAVKREAGSYMIGSYQVQFRMSIDNTLYCFTGNWRVFNNGKGTVSAGIFTAVPTNTSDITADASRVYLITRGVNSAAVTLEKIYPFESSLVGIPITQAQVMRVFFSALKEVSPSNGATGINLINIGLAAAAENSGLDTWDKLKNSFIKKHREYMTQGKSVETFLLEVCGVNLTNVDTGSIIGKDAGGDVEYDAQDIVKEDVSLAVGTGIQGQIDFSAFIRRTPALLELFPEDTYSERHFDGIRFVDTDTGKSLVFGYWSDFPAYNPRTGQKETIGTKQLWLLKLVVSHMIKPSLKLIKDAYGLDLINDGNINSLQMPTNVMLPNGLRRCVNFSNIGDNFVPIYLSSSPYRTNFTDLNGNYNTIAFFSPLANNITNNGYRSDMCEMVINTNTIYSEDNIVSGNLNGVSKMLSTIFYLDRSLAHELLHAAQFCCIPRWSNEMPICITEGLAELLHGIDDTRKDIILEVFADIPDASGDCRVKAALNAEYYTPYRSGGAYYGKLDHNGKAYNEVDLYIVGPMILRYFCKAAANSKK